jgi:Xaa-Pro aminopeptidase
MADYFKRQFLEFEQPIKELYEQIEENRKLAARNSKINYDPVNGRFSSRQKLIYNACLHLHQFAASILKPGISIIDYTEKVGEEATVIFQKIGLLNKADIKSEDPDNKAYRKYLYHGISHHLGIDVHDLGTRTEPIEAGMVFTVEPGIYIEEEQMGIRIENNYWITKNGNKDLMKSIPITVEDIEGIMKKAVSISP